MSLTKEQRYALEEIKNKRNRQPNNLLTSSSARRHLVEVNFLLAVINDLQSQLAEAIGECLHEEWLSDFETGCGYGYVQCADCGAIKKFEVKEKK